MFDLNHPKVETFLQEWFDLGVYQFGRQRNQVYTDLEGYKEFIRKCRRRKLPAFASIQPKLKMVNLFYEFDVKSDIEKYSYDSSKLELGWLECRLLAQNMIELGAHPLTFYSGRRGYHLYVFIGEWGFEPETESKVKKLYKGILYGLMKGVKYSTFDNLPTHINALSRIPFSYHQKTDNQVIPLTLDKEPYLPDVSEFRDNPIPMDKIKIMIEKIIYPGKSERPDILTKEKHFTDWNIRDCIKTKMILEPTHYARLAFLLDAIYANITDEQLHAFFKQYPDYTYEKTQYQITYQRKQVERKKNPLKPVTCKVLREWGICDESCYKYADHISWGEMLKNSKKD